MTSARAVAGVVLAAGALSLGSAATEPVQDRVISDPRIAESSGLAASTVHDGVVWTVNDSGDDAVIYAIAAAGATSAVVSLVDATGAPLDARDVEAVAPLPGGGLVVADIGDNRGRRESVVLRVVADPIPLLDGPVRAHSLRVRYPGPAADAETLLVDGVNGRWFIVTKQLVGAQVFEVPPAAVAAATTGDAPAETVVLQRLGGLEQGLVTDGAVLPDGRVVLRDYRRAVLYEPMADGGGMGRRVSEIVTPAAPQAESLAATPDGGSVLVGSEGADSVVWRVPVPAAPAPPSVARPAEVTPSGGDGHRRVLVLGACAVCGLALVATVVRRRRR